MSAAGQAALAAAGCTGRLPAVPLAAAGRVVAETDGRGDALAGDPEGDADRDTPGAGEPGDARPAPAAPAAACPAVALPYAAAGTLPDDGPVAAFCDAGFPLTTPEHAQASSPTTPRPATRVKNRRCQ